MLLVGNKRDARLRLGLTVDMALSPFLWTDAKHFDDDATEVHCSKQHSILLSPGRLLFWTLDDHLLIYFIDIIAGYLLIGYQEC